MYQRDDSCKYCGTGHPLAVFCIGQEMQWVWEAEPFQGSVKVHATTTPGLTWWKVIQNIGQTDNLHAGEPDEQDRSSDVERVKYSNLDSIMFIIFTKLESSMIQR